MTRGKARTHLDASTSGQPLRRARCGWLNVDTETDATLVSCKTCLSLLAAKRQGPPAGRKSGKSEPARAEVAAELASAFAATLAPNAGPPPRLTAALWAASCKGAEHRKCGACVMCEWERDAEMWNAVSPWNIQLRAAKPEGAPRWPSLAHALVALAEWEAHGRHAKSAIGAILDRCKRGDIGDGERSRPDDPLLRRAGELVRVGQALDLAYPVDGHAKLSAAQCKSVLLLRTPGVVSPMASYEALGELLGAGEGELRAVVKHGRRVVTDELSTRGVIPVPRPTRSHAPNVTAYQAQEEVSP